MTEDDWLCCNNPHDMLSGFPLVPSERKLRLFGCAVCRRVWELMLDGRCREAVEASELFADGLIAEMELDALSAAAEEAHEDAVSDDDHSAANVAHAVSYCSSPSLDLGVLAGAVDSPAEEASGGFRNEHLAQAILLRCIFGNPFRPVAFDPAWRSDTALSLARGMYESRDFSTIPILADALQDAGCDQGDILDHCRDPKQVHVRGCWVVDLVLCKE